ncbi:uncharacterized protein UV8b_03866 [Ustilaginoidea virens]|uniref:Transmembrane protein n=1 Tax=Ustilaginoidea virens TaxID=1159556 RepID=A0A8E5HQ58_USTVR|nr:uncharacterized protein UV8b_03866 [Ustilaginoidea virens]QUC19625.1 hypothetical protein UV8b_03866 [Ustilaginoidea virens]
MNRILIPRTLRGPRRFLAVGISAAACTSCLVFRNPNVQLHVQSPVERPSTTPRTTVQRSGFSTSVIRQISSGSLAGCLTGLLAAMLSKTLIFIGSLIALSLHISSRFHRGFSYMPRISRLLGSSTIYQAGVENPWFTSSFAVAFALATFARL